MAQRYILALDIGSSTVKGMVASLAPKKGPAEIVAFAEVTSDGVRRGIIYEAEGATKAVSELLDTLEVKMGQELSEGVVGVGGTHLGARKSRGTIVVSRPDGEITEEDIERVVQSSKAVMLPQNRQILYAVPHEFFIDGQGGIRSPLGMQGMRLEAESLIVDAFSPAISTLEKTLELASLKPTDLVPMTLAGARAGVLKKEKELGVLAVDIGAGTTTLSVFEDGKLLHAAVLPVGSAAITNDIAIGLKISVDAAEKIKIEEGCAVKDRVPKREMVELSNFIEGEESAVSKKYISEIIEARAEEILNLINAELKKIDRFAKLPAGVVLFGGGAKLAGIDVLVKKICRLPVRFATLEGIGLKANETLPLQFFPACGLILWALDSFTSGARQPKGILARIKGLWRIFFP